MKTRNFLIFGVSLVISLVAAQSPLGPDVPSQDLVSNFQPSLGVVIAILSIMFAITVSLLLVARFCSRERDGNEELAYQFGSIITRTSSRSSGLDKTVIESLPFFRFSSLKGSKGGLECAVCLSKFEDIELLRLLPKCKHAFHINCVDRWLEKHSSCPLCRHKVSIEDSTIYSYPNSSRFVSNRTELEQLDQLEHESSMELFVEREENKNTHVGWSARFSIGNSFRKPEKGKTENEILLHKVNHRIIFSEHVTLKNRWSNVSSSDLIFLNSEMVNEVSSDRFSSLIESKTEKRSMSEITGVSRYGKTEDCSSSNGKEERIRKLWLPIARKTAQWFVHRDERFHHQQLDV